MYAVYRFSCPSCGGEIKDFNLALGIPCDECLRRAGLELLKEKPELRREPWVRERLASLGGPLAELLKLEERLEEVERLFSEATGSVLWSAQRAWALRALRGESFSIVAPTGMGKTTFGALMAVYLAKKRGKKSYVVVPTTPLVTMVAEKAAPFAEALGAEVVYLHSKMPPSARREMEAALAEGRFDVLITTSRFLINKLELLKGFEFGFIFVDDVDSVLKSPKNVDRLLILLGLDEADVRKLDELDRELSRKLSVLTRTNDLVKRYELLKEMSELEAELERLRAKVRGNLVVSSATGRARGRRVRLFARLLGFSPGGAGEGLRNVVDSYTKRSYVELVRALGRGGLVFVPADWGVGGAERVAEELRSVGIKAEAVSSERSGAIERFAQGELDVLVGIATHYGVLVRGIDLPHVVRYAVFTAVPRFKFRLKLEEPSVMTIIRLTSLAAGLYEEYAKLYAKLKRWLQRLAPGQLKEVEERLKDGKAESPAERDFLEAYLKLKELVEKEEFLRRLEESGEVEVVREGGALYVLVPDAATYLQASGRTSRLYAGGVTKGLSVVVVDSEPLFRGLKRRLRWVVEEWKRFEELNLEELLKEIDEDRKKVLKVMRGELKADEVRKLMKTVLLVVESPNKARTITSFFGRPTVRQVKGAKVYEISLGSKYLYVAASGGHVYDLAGEAEPECWEGRPCTFFGIRVNGRPEQVLTSIRRCSVCGHQFSDDVDRCPRCGAPFLKDSKDVIEGLKLLAQEVDEVLIGTDPDTEGEKIGWDVRNLIAPFARKIRRAEFHEVTKKAILKALDEPRNFDMGYVWSQMVRRAEDRLTGFTLSPKLWFDLWPEFCEEARREGKEVPGCPITRNLSAGRVQTPVLGWVIKRYEEYKESRRKFYRVRFGGWEVEFSEEEVLGPLREAEAVKVEKVEEREEELKPLPPYTTDALLEESNARLKLDATGAMRLAQDLFEMGFITYHRTDSTRVSDAGIA
ncbi:MAG: reverse gyrase, partial [Crenarchaeota archaeon]|nr:reverse gyrase [Thermoproteota archaeon]